MKTRDHRRNRSELHPPTTKKTTTAVQTKKRKGGKNGMSSQGQMVKSALHTSNQRIAGKRVLVEDLQEVGEEEGGDFFCFGKGGYRRGMARADMEEIEEVPDTGSYSQRNTQHERLTQENKENYPTWNNHFWQHHPPPLPLLQLKRPPTPCTNVETIPLTGQRMNKRTRGKSADCSQSRSTVELSKVRRRERSRSKGKSSYGQNQVQQLKLQAVKMERSIKMIWECMGDMWHSHRQHRQLSQRNETALTELSRQVESHSEQMMDFRHSLAKISQKACYRA